MIGDINYTCYTRRFGVSGQVWIHATCMKQAKKELFRQMKTYKRLIRPDFAEHDFTIARDCSILHDSFDSFLPFDRSRQAVSLGNRWRNTLPPRLISVFKAEDYTRGKILNYFTCNRTDVALVTINRFLCLTRAARILPSVLLVTSLYNVYISRFNILLVADTFRFYLWDL